MFRCPSCAVVWKLPLTKDHSLLSNKTMDKWTIEKEPVSFFSKVDTVKDLSDLGQKLLKHGLNFGNNGVTVENSPVLECPSCHEHHPFTKWHDAWNKPMEYFDADQLCSCGGELWWDKIPGTPRYALVCDKCEWAKPKAVISGHAE